MAECFFSDVRYQGQVGITGADLRKGGGRLKSSDQDDLHNCSIMLLLFASVLVFCFRRICIFKLTVYEHENFIFIVHF